jgi:hypothetical protein
MVRALLLLLLSALVAAATLLGCEDEPDRDATEAFRAHLAHVHGQHVKVTYANTDPLTAGLVSYVLYLSGDPGRFRLDVSASLDDEQFDYSIFDNPDRDVVCTESPTFTGGESAGVCFENSDPYFAGVGYELAPALFPDAHTNYPVMSTWRGSTLGQDTECFEVRVSGPHAVDDTRASYCFSSDSILMESIDSHVSATQIVPATAADFELPYPVTTE